MTQFIQIETQSDSGEWSVAFGMAPKKPITDPGFEPAVRDHLRANFSARFGQPIRVVADEEPGRPVLLTFF